jgi:hypothetical protein
MQLTAQFADELVPRDQRFNGVKVFSATLFADRERLGDEVSSWLASRPEVKVMQIVVTQSSDAASQCIAVTVFYWEQLDR